MSREAEYKLALENILSMRAHAWAKGGFRPCLADAINIAEQALGLKPGRDPIFPGRDTTAAAKSLIGADDELLQTYALRDPSMLRDVAAALIWERECRVNEHRSVSQPSR